MRILLDESLPRQLGREFVGHEADDVHALEWSGKENGELLALAEAEFDAFVTADRNLQYQQNIAGFDLRIVVLAASSNRLPDLIPLVPRAIDLLGQMDPGTIREVR